MRKARSINVLHVRLNHGLRDCLALILFCSLWQVADFIDNLSVGFDPTLFNCDLYALKDH